MLTDFYFVELLSYRYPSNPATRNDLPKKQKSSETFALKKLTDPIEGEAVAPGVEGDRTRLWPHPTDP